MKKLLTSIALVLAATTASAEMFQKANGDMCVEHSVGHSWNVSTGWEKVDVIKTAITKEVWISLERGVMIVSVEYAMEFKTGRMMKVMCKGR